MATQLQRLLRIILFILIVVVGGVPLVNSQGTERQKPILVRVHREHGRLVFTLEPDPTPGKDILWGLSALMEQRGRNYPVIALVDENAQIGDLDQVPGIAAKAGFASVRTFVVRHATGKMAEMKFCSALPISANPPEESACASAK